jgi:3'(2'), 5'-bisphosphate nucleotidase
MIGYVEDGEPVLGIIYNAVEDKLYYALKGQGAFLVQNDETKRIFCNDREPSECIASISSTPKKNIENVLNKLEINKFKSRGSMGLKAMDIAEGLSNIYLNFDKKSSYWDSAAPYVKYLLMLGDSFGIGMWSNY